MSTHRDTLWFAAAAEAGPALRRHLAWLAVAWALAALAGCASTAKPGAASTGSGLGGEGPVLFGVRGLEGPHPRILLPEDEARAMGISGPQPAPPDLVDRLAASCDEASQQIDCKRFVQTCRYKTCEVVPAFP
ncbi:MAG TPA: hypothetical protein VFG59_13890 [Anaeromyxobacter sp.]|nr:hypothetical protein [Anaeromyxobacter sp.]